MTPQTQKYLDEKLESLVPLYAEFVTIHIAPAWQLGEAGEPAWTMLKSDTENAILRAQAVASMLFVPAVKRVSLEYLTQQLPPDPWLVGVALLELHGQPSLQFVHSSETIWLEWSGEELSKFQLYQFDIARQNPGNHQILLKAREAGGEMIPDVRQFQAGQVLDSAYTHLMKMLQACPSFDSVVYKFNHVSYVP